MTHDVVRMPYMIGVYLGVNAFPDVFLMVDGPDCLFFKAEYVHGSQDLNSTLLSAVGHHRVVHTLADTVNVVTDREAEVMDLVRRLARQPDAGMVLLTAMPMAAITGSQYDRIGRLMARELCKPVVDLPGRSLDGDWLDGYMEVLAAVARGMPDPAGPPDPEAVAVVGLLLDRTEADRLGDVLEVGRLIEQGLGLKVAAVWPSNAPVATLSRALLAGTIVALPYGRKAARILATRTGARLVEADLPLGLEASAAFVRVLAEATGRCADRFIAAELERAELAFREVRGRGLEGKRFAVIADPFLAAGLARAAQDVGATVVAALSTHYPFRPVADLPGHEAFRPGLEADLCLTNTRGIEIAIELGLPWMEVGFPSYGTHALATAPILGFRGAVRLAERLWNHLEFLKSWSCPPRTPKIR